MGLTSEWYEREYQDWKQRNPEAARELEEIQEQEEDRLLIDMHEDYLKQKEEKREQQAQA